MEIGFTEHRKGELCYETVPLFDRAGGLRHMVTTRLGGVSEGEFQSLNIGIRRPDNKEHIMENLHRAVTAMDGTFPNLVISRQVHETHIRTVTEQDAGEGARGETDTEEADGLITDCPHIPLLTYYADCVPLMFYDPKRRVIATSHAGWKGTVKHIGRKTIRKMKTDFGCNVTDILCAVGPSIGKCCFEVDLPVAEQFRAEIGDAVVTPMPHQKFMVDLWQANISEFLNEGIPDAHIALSGECTKCNNHRYFSNRAQGGKMGNHGVIMELR